MAETAIKHTFLPERGSQPLSSSCDVLDVIARANGRFPHVKHGNLTIEGQLGKTGVVVSNPGGTIVASVRSPNWIPTRIDGVQVEYGGGQTDKHIERSLLIEASDDEVRRHAEGMLAGLAKYKDLHDLARFYAGAGAGGSEPEAWLIAPDGSPFPVTDGGELQSCLVEEQIRPIGNPGDFLIARAQQIVKRKEKYPSAIVVDTSSLTTASPAEVHIGTAGENGPYVSAIQNKLWSDYMHCLDPVARQLMDNLSTTFGYTNWADMHTKLGDMAYLVFSASHLSIGLPHMRDGLEAMTIPEQEAIAVADMFNTNFGTLAEMLMLSTPMVFNQTPTVNIEGETLWPRDMRAIMRYTLDTTHPGEFIMTPERYRARVSRLIETGLSHTLDRAAYMAVLEGPSGEHIEQPVMHGRVRLRAATTEPLNQSGRVEFTGCSASPSIHDEAARNALLQLMMIGAYEALAEGKHPINYFKKEFASMGRWQEQKDLIMEANLYGFKAPHASSLINEGLAFALRMGEKYPALREQVTLVTHRLLNLWETPVETLAEYVDNPKGPFSEVVQKELRSGKTPLEVTKAIEAYQLAMAKKILEAGKLND